MKICFYPGASLIASLVLVFIGQNLKAQTTSYHFDFGGGKGGAGAVVVSPTNTYSDDAGFGFEPSTPVAMGNHSITSTNPFYFSAKLPEGNYRVHVVLGDDSVDSITTVKAELRRLMLEKVHAAPGAPVERTFIVNLRTPQIDATNHVHLKPREKSTEIWDWDDKMTLEFNGTNPAVASLDIEKVDLPTVYLIGDSTMCDQPSEPWNSWGQMLPRFLKPDVAVANHAESGETIADSLKAQRFEKIFSLMKPGDYLFIQFGHNDMKDKATNALVVYKANFKKVVERTRALGGTPVLVTSMERKSGFEQGTLLGYPQTVRDVAMEEHCALIDLNAMSKEFYTALGTNIGRAFQDGTHHDNYGSYELAKCVVLGIKQTKLPPAKPGEMDFGDAHGLQPSYATVPTLANLPLAKSIVDDFGDFDPSKPDDVNTFVMAVSPNVSTAKPLGN